MIDAQSLILFMQIWKHKVDGKMDELWRKCFFVFLTSHLSSVYFRLEEKQLEDG